MAKFVSLINGGSTLTPEAQVLNFSNNAQAASAPKNAAPTDEFVKNAPQQGLAGLMNGNQPRKMAFPGQTSSSLFGSIRRS